MYTYQRTTSDNLDFQDLVLDLDRDLAVKNGESNAFFAQYNTLNKIKHVIVAYDSQGIACGCGAMKEYEADTMEIKRMFVPLAQRGNGIAGQILVTLQQWAKELGYVNCVLETGDKMTEAIGLYKKHHFNVIPNYGPYAEIESSICFAKKLITI